MTPESFRLATDPFPEPALLVTAAGVVAAANRAAGTRLGLRPDALAGRPLAEWSRTPADEAAAFLRACARTTAPVPGTLTLAAADGRAAVCRAEGALVRPAADGREALVLLRLIPKEAAVARFLALNQRIDELSREVARRKKAEAELRAERERLRVTLASIGDAVVATDDAGAVAFLNPVAEALTGWRRDEAVGRPLPEVFAIIHEYTRLPAENPVTRVFRDGAVVGLANHTVLVARDGAERPIDDSAAPIRDADGRLVGAVLVFRDVTERRRVDRELRDRADRLAEANRHKDEFLSMLAHELRNPLAPVVNGLQLLRMAGQDPAVTGRTVGMMERQVRHLTRLIDDLLDVSRIARGKVRLKRGRLDLAPLVRTTVEDRRPAVERAGLALEVAAPDAGVWVDGDPTRLTQVVGNLLDNAAKFTEPGGRVAVSVGGEGREAVVRVCDSGVGIDADLLPYLFQAFRQGDRSLDRTKGGLGLGLALVKGLTELHGGRVEAHSKGPGCGAEFVVRLPLTLPGAAPTAARPVATGEGHGVRVLIIEDNRDAADSLCTVLELLGHEVSVTYTGPEGVRTAREWRPAVVLSDIGLPGQDGFAVAAAIRQDAALRGSTLVALTGYGGEEDARRARASGFDHVLVKPADPVALQRLLDEVWRRTHGP